MKKMMTAALTAGLLLICISVQAIEKSVCAAEEAAALAFQQEIVSSFLNEEIEKEDVRTLGLAATGLFYSGLDCEAIKIDLSHLKQTASKLKK